MKIGCYLMSVKKCFRMNVKKFIPIIDRLPNYNWNFLK